MKPIVFLELRERITKTFYPGGNIMTMNKQIREMIHQGYPGLMGARADLLVAVKEILASAGYTSGEAEPTLRELGVGIVALQRGREAVRKAEKGVES